MYEELNCFERALKHFGTRVEVIVRWNYQKVSMPKMPIK